MCKSRRRNTPCFHSLAVQEGSDSGNECQRRRRSEKNFFVLFWRRINAQRCFDVMYEQCIGFCAKRALGRHRSCSYCRERAESSHSKGFLKGKLQEKYVAACSRMQPHAAACSSMQQHAAACSSMKSIQEIAHGAS